MTDPHGTRLRVESRVMQGCGVSTPISLCQDFVLVSSQFICLENCTKTTLGSSQVTGSSHRHAYTTSSNPTPQSMEALQIENMIPNEHPNRLNGRPASSPS